MSTVKSILFLGFPNFGEQDLLAPWELLRALAWTMRQQGESLEVTLGSFEGGTITTHMGAKIESERTITADDRFDVLYIPGGIGAGAASQHQPTLDLVRAHHEEGRWVAANCAGLGVLLRAGILDGVEVTSPATVERKLRQLGAKVVSPRQAWKIDQEHKIFTAGGAGTVHASTIALVWQLFGEEKARDLAGTWDSLPFYGESLFALDGPALNDDDAAKSRLQDAWENTFLPD